MTIYFHEKKIMFNISLQTIFQARYVFAFMSMLGLSLALMMRFCLSLVITRMVPNTSNVSSQEKTYSWSEQTQGIILAAFYVGYLISHIPGAMLSEKFGGKYPFGLGILFTAIFTLLTPTMVRDNPIGIIVLRCLEGVCEGSMYPALYTLLARWAPPNEKSFITTLTLLGSLIGSLLSNLITGIILGYYSDSSWKLVFYFFGTISIIWYLYWWALCYTDPQSHPYISESEKQYFVKEIGTIERDQNLQPAPWKHILTSSSVWVFIVAGLGHDWGIYTTTNDLPKYFNDVQKVTPVQNGLLFTYSYIMLFFVSWISSSVSDWILGRKYLSVGFMRKLYATIAAVGFTAGILIASYAQNTSIIIACVIIGLGSLAFEYSSINLIALDLSPNYSGSIYAVVNGIGCISGILTPYLTGLLTPNRSAEEWRTVFWIMGGVMLVTNSIFLVFGSCEIESWNDLHNETVSKPDMLKMSRSTKYL